VILALDIGNSQIFGGLFEASDTVRIRFRKSSRPPTSADELGVFLRSVIRENGGDPAAVSQIACCSVVPDAIYSVRNCCRRYFGIDPFVLGAGAKTGLRIRYRNAVELGADRVAAAIAAAHLFADQGAIIVDFGTATTIDAVTADREHLGGVILPGLRIQMEALEQNTARLPNVEIRPAGELLGRSTIECIQAGLYFGTRAAVAGLTRDIQARYFAGQPCRVVATGGFARLFEHDPVFDVYVPDLVLVGLKRALSLNPDAGGRWTMPHGDDGITQPA
jgi:type III pantothenate kinase